MASFVTLLAFFSASRAAANQVRLAWDANTEADLAGYRVYYGTAPTDLSQTADVGIATTSSIQGLTAGTDYYFAVTAYNSDGLESDRSEPIFYRTPKPLSRATFSGLIGEAGGSLNGAFTANLSVTGQATGRVLLNGKAYSWLGSFDEARQLSVQIFSRAGLLIGSLSLKLDSDGTSVTGTVETSNGTADLLAHAAPAPGKTLNAGRYTMALASETSADGSGYGFGLINVSNRGDVRFTGTIPSGARFTAGLRLDSAETAPLCIFQRASLRTIFGRVHFRDLPGESDADAVLRAQQVLAPDEIINLKAARFTGLLGQGAQSKSSNGQSTLALGVTRLGEAQVAGQVAGRTSFVGSAATGELLSLKISSRTGLFSGACTSPGKPSLNFTGALFRKTDQEGYGRGRGVSAAVEVRNVP